MKITGFEFKTVSIPFRRRIREHWGWDYPTTLVWVHTDEGITGLGESNSLTSNIGTRADDLARRYVGKSIWDLNLADEPFDLQCAFYDIASQALGVPIHRLLGGKVRDKVELAFWSPPMPPEEMARESVEGRELGFRTHKIKGHRPHDVVPICRLINDALGAEMQIRVDPNTALRDYPNAVRIARQCEGFNIEVWEDPFLFADMSQYRQFRQKVTAPVARHSGSERDMFLWLKGEAIDCFNAGGNAGRMHVLDSLAQAAGVPIWGQMFAFGSCVGTMFAVQIASTLKACTMALDELPHIRENDLSGGSFRTENGCVTVPDTPGLGVTLDMAAVKKYEKPAGYIGTIKQKPPGWS